MPAIGAPSQLWFERPRARTDVEEPGTLEVYRRPCVYWVPRYVRGPAKGDGQRVPTLITDRYCTYIDLANVLHCTSCVCLAVLLSLMPANICDWPVCARLSVYPFVSQSP